MKFIADLHIHSKYARAVSPKMNLPELDRWADDKGITVMGTGDFTHPDYFKEIKEQLEPAEEGLYRLKKEYKLPTIKGNLAQNTRFMLTSEISSIYTRDGRGRRVHTLFFCPDIETVEKVNAKLVNKGANLRSDARPIVGIDVRELAKIFLEVNKKCVIVPAHIWTPWFAMFGSKSGFNSIKECFGDYAENIFAIETGLSSDPLMNWQVSELDNVAIISNSDSHSLERIGREANIFNTALSYDGIIAALKENTQDKFLGTIEYFPEEGRYHLDGHRKCGISWQPKETRKNRGICSECGRPVVVGVLNRLAKLADRKEEDIPIKEVLIGQVKGKVTGKRIPFVNLITLDSILAEAKGVKGTKTKAVKTEYNFLIKSFGNELDILMNISLNELSSVAIDQVVEAIKRMREQKFSITPGYDGEYGIVKIFSEAEKKKQKTKTLFG